MAQFTPFRDPKTNILYPSKEYFTSREALLGRGLTPTGSRIKTEIGKQAGIGQTAFGPTTPPAGLPALDTTSPLYGLQQKIGAIGPGGGFIPYPTTTKPVTKISTPPQEPGKLGYIDPKTGQYIPYTPLAPTPTPAPPTPTVPIPPTPVTPAPPTPPTPTPPVVGEKPKLPEAPYQGQLFGVGTDVYRYSADTGTWEGVPPGTEEQPNPPTTDVQKGTFDMVSQIDTVVTAIGDLTKAIKDRPSLVDQYRTMMDEAGVPDLKNEMARLQGRANVIEEQLETLPEDVQKRVQDFLVTQTQYERITAAEAKPLTKLYNALARASEAKGFELQQARQGVMDVLGLWEKDMSRVEDALKTQIGMAKLPFELQEMMARVEEREKAPIGAGQYLGLTGTQATTFQTDLETEITNVYSGRYGVEGSREQALTRLEAKYPGLPVSDLIYGNPAKGIPATFPGGYEAKIVPPEEEKVTAYQRKVEQLANLNATIIQVATNYPTSEEKSAIAKDLFWQLTQALPQLSQWEIKAAMDAQGFPTEFIGIFAF